MSPIRPSDEAMLARALTAATSLTRPCTHPKEPAVKPEDHSPTDLVHDPAEDVSERRRVTGVEREVVDLLELEVEHRPWVRLSNAQWRRVDAVAARIARADATVPAPRTTTENDMPITTPEEK